MGNWISTNISKGRIYCNKCDKGRTKYQRENMRRIRKNESRRFTKA